jgi:hypothetical protein
MNPQDLQVAQSSGMAPIFYSPGQVQPDVPAGSPQQTNLPAKGPSGLEGFLERNAQTIGGIAGGIGGEIIDPFGGGIAGAALGQGLGQEIKNKTTGTTTNPFEEAAIGGASELGGLGVGKAISKGAGALKNAAPDLFKSAFNVPNELLTRLKPNETAQKMLDYGVGGSLNNIVDKSNSAMDVLDRAYRDSVGQIKQPIDMNGAIDAANNIINSPYSTDLTEADKNKIVKDIGAMGAQAPGTLPKSQYFLKNGLGGDTGISKIGAQDAVDSMRQLQDVGHTLLAKGENKLNPNPRLSQMGRAYLAAGDHIQGKLDELGGSASAKAVQTPENKAALSEISPKLADEFMAAKTPQQIRTIMAPFHNVKTMAKITLDNPAKGKLLAQLTGAAGGFGLGGPIGALAGMVGSPIIEGAENAIRAPITTGAAKVVNGVADRAGKLAGGGSKDIIGNLSPADAMSQIATQGTGSSVGDLFTGSGQQPPASPNPASSAGAPGSVASLVSSSIDSTITPLLNQKNGTSSNVNVPSLADLLQAGGTQGVSDYLAYQKQETPQLTQTQQDDWEKAQNAVSAVKDLASTFDQVQASGAVAGSLEELGTKIPGIQNTKSESALKTYNDNVGQLASTLSQVLGGGRGSKAMLEELKPHIPTINDSPQAAAMKLNTIVTLLGQAMNTILSAPATNTPGQLANFSGQTVPGSVNFSTPYTAMQNTTPDNIIPTTQ